MAITATYGKDGSIVVRDNGSTYVVPDDMANRERRRLAASNIVIAPYVAPAITPEEQRVTDFEALPERRDLIDRLKTATPAQIDTWLTANVTTLAQARAVLGQILKVLATRV